MLQRDAKLLLKVHYTQSRVTCSVVCLSYGPFKQSNKYIGIISGDQKFNCLFKLTCMYPMHRRPMTGILARVFKVHGIERYCRV
jgi:hypothetical protein